MDAAPNECAGYGIERKLGTGSYATVWLARKLGDERPVALKAISRERLTQKLTENLESEMSILREFAHPNLVELVEIAVTPSYVYIVLEYMRGGDLQKYIRSSGRLSESTVRRFMADLASGLDFLWSKNLIHRDLKPQNLLLTRPDASANLKIADFGFARRLESAALAETLCGSPLYMAPEILSFKPYDAKADLWSIGAILFEMLAGYPPFTGGDHRELLHNIKRTTLRLPLDVTVSSDCLWLLQHLLKREPEGRVSLDEFVNCDFVTKQQEGEDGDMRDTSYPSSEQGGRPGTAQTTSMSSSSTSGHPTVAATTPSPCRTHVDAPREPVRPSTAEAGPLLIEEQRRVRAQEPANTMSSGEFVVVDHGTRRRRTKSQLASDYAEEALGCAAALSWVGDAVCESPLEALAVYLQALRVVRRAFVAARSGVEAAERPRASERPGALVALSRHQYDVLIARAQDARVASRDPAMKHIVRKSSAKKSELVNAALVVYEVALFAARTGAARELLGDLQGAYNRYMQASRCLAALIFSFDLDSPDRAAILSITTGHIDPALERIAAAMNEEKAPSS